jgi:hypothetical protein
MLSDGPIAPDIAQLIQLFRAQVDLRFPGLDAEVLQAALVQVMDPHEAVLRAEAELQTARAALENEQEALLKVAQRAHAYLSVYAETDEQLAPKVSAISLPRLRRGLRVESTPGASEDLSSPAPKKRGRPRKSAAPEDVSLFSGEGGAQPPAATPA